jgi:hypothetical protein
MVVRLPILSDNHGIQARIDVLVVAVEIYCGPR